MDWAWAMAKESTFGTPVTVSRFYPYLPGCSFEWDPRPRQGKGVQGGSGRRAMLGSRRFLPTGQGTLKTVVELEDKAAGVLLDVALGASTVTPITGGSQQVFHSQVSGTTVPSATIQVQKVLNDGTVRTETYRGCTATKVTIDQPQDDIPTVEVEWDALGMSTATGAATLTYASAPTLFDAYQAAAGWGGTLTVPTTTALGSGLTAITAFRSWKLTIDNQAAVDRWRIGGRGQPLVGAPQITFSAEVEANDTTFATALTAGTQTPFTCTYTTGATLGSGNTQMQVAIPLLGLNSGLPQSGNTPVVHSIAADVLSDGTNRDFYVVIRTTDSGL